MKNASNDAIFLNIAGFIIKIKFQINEFDYLINIKKNEIKKYYKNFIKKESPQHIDYEIIFLKNIDLKTLYSDKNKKNYISFYFKKRKKILTYYHIGIAQFQFLLKEVIFDLLTKNKGFLIHCSAIQKNEKAFIFVGKPGSGKSTIRSILSKKYKPLADDSGIVKKERGKYYFYQTPFLEKKSIKKNSQKYELGKIFFLKKANFFLIKKIQNKKYILKRMIKQFFYLKEKYDDFFIKNALNLLKEDFFYFVYFSKRNNKKIIL
jgi:hypothetical protein